MKIGKRYIPNKNTYEQASLKQAARLGITTKREINAFAHAFTSALVARDWGESTASLLGYVNELQPGNKTDEWAKDRHNNVPGILTGKNKPVGTSDDVIADEIKQRMDRGQLIINREETGLPKEPLGEPGGGSEKEILQEAVARMRNISRGLPPDTLVGEEDKLFRDDLRREAIARGAKLLGPHRYSGPQIVEGLRAFFKKK